MNFHIMTLFPEMVYNGLNTSITGRAIEKGLINIETWNIRDYTIEKHGRTDDYPYGGGAGMLMQAQPVYDCYKAVLESISSSGSEKKPRVLYMSPQGKVFDQKMAEELANESDLVLLCGHYEGIDERALELTGAEPVSVGDYVLTGGELPAMVIIDCVSRLIKGVLGHEESHEIESFQDNMLEYPQYTRPEEFEGLKVPDILLSGHHANIAKWQRERSIERTFERRPDLFKKIEFNKNDLKLLKEILPEDEYDALRSKIADNKKKNDKQ